MKGKKEGKEREKVGKKEREKDGKKEKKGREKQGKERKKESEMKEGRKERERESLLYTLPSPLTLTQYCQLHGDSSSHL